MKIQLLYFDGCPSWRQAEENLKAALSEQGILDPIEHVRVETPEEAARLCFPGSPTIRIDGKDIEPVVDKGKTFSLTCRIYREGGQARGWPSVEKIKQLLRKSAG